MSIKSKWIANDTHWSINPNAPCFNYIFCHHIGEIPIIHQQHYDSFPSVLINISNLRHTCIGWRFKKNTVYPSTFTQQMIQYNAVQTWLQPGRSWFSSLVHLDPWHLRFLHVPWQVYLLYSVLDLLHYMWGTSQGLYSKVTRTFTTANASPVTPICIKKYLWLFLFSS